MGESIQPVSPLSVLGTKRIAFYTDDPGEGGVAVYVHSMVCALARGIDVTCIQSQADGPLQAIQRQLGVKHQWLPYNTRSDFPRTASNVSDAEQAYAAVRPDVVVFANCDPFSSLAAKNFAIQKEIPFVIVEGYVVTPKTITPMSPGACRFTADQYQRAKAVITVSQENLDLLHRHYGLAAVGPGSFIMGGQANILRRSSDADASSGVWNSASRTTMSFA